MYLCPFLDFTSTNNLYSIKTCPFKQGFILNFCFCIYMAFCFQIECLLIHKKNYGFSFHISSILLPFCPIIHLTKAEICIFAGVCDSAKFQ